MERNATLRINGTAWKLVLHDEAETTVEVSGKDRKAAIRQHGLSDDDDGAVLKVRVQKNHGLKRWDLKGIIEVAERSPRMHAEAEAARAKQDQARRDQAAAATRIEREQRQTSLTERRKGGARTSEELQRRYRSGHTETPEVNAYTFLPFVTDPPTDRWAAPVHRTEPTSPTHEAPKVEPRHSGRIVLDLHVATPLCIFGAETKEAATHRASRRGFEPCDGSDKHGRISILRDSSGSPTIPGSSLKGVTRSWLEAITSSERRSDESPVAWRSPGVGRHRRLGRLTLTTLDGKATKLQVTSPDRWSDSDRWPSNLRASITPLRAWDAGVGDVDEEQRLSERFRRTIDAFGLTGRLTDGMEVKKKADGSIGFLKTGKSVQGDVSLYVALKDAHDGPAIPVSTTSLHGWIAAHVDSGKPRSVEPRPAFRIDKMNIDAPDPRILNNGDLVWYQLNDDGHLAYFGRLRNGRWAELEPLEGKEPAGHEREPGNDQLSVVRRILGYADGTDGLSGLVRFAPAHYLDDKEQIDQYTLRALSSPKLASAGLYLDGRDDNVSWVTRDNTTSWLRGTKVYWHTVPPEQPDMPTDARVVQEETDHRGVIAKTTQNKTVDALRSGRFRTVITFEELTELELGALLLAVTLRFDELDRRRGWKLGIGKPVGLGSLHNDLVRLELRSESWAADPISVGLEDASGQVERLMKAAREHFIPSDDEREVFAQIADHHVHVDRIVGYPGLGKLIRGADGDSRRQPTAREVLEGNNMELRRQQRR